MFEKYIVLKRKHTVMYSLYLGICFMWICLCADVQSQSLEKKAGEVKLAETGITVKAEDSETARMKAEELKTTQGKFINEIELLISNLEKIHTREYILPLRELMGLEKQLKLLF